MASDKIEGHESANIDFNSKVTLKMVIEVVAVAVAGVSMWYSIRAEIREVSHDLEEINQRLVQLDQTRWIAADDYVFMERYSKINSLKMPEGHKGTD